MSRVKFGRIEGGVYWIFKNNARDRLGRNCVAEEYFEIFEHARKTDDRPEAELEVFHGFFYDVI